MNERKAQAILTAHCLHRLHHQATVPNSTMLLYDEADLLSVTPAGLVHEYEIKLTMQDFRRELGSNPKYNKAAKHQRLKQGPSIYRSYAKIPNYFWFVTHDLDIEQELPDYCGWISLNPYAFSAGYFVNVRKKAPRLHDGKWDSTQVAKIARLLSYRLLNTYKYSV